MDEKMKLITLNEHKWHFMFMKLVLGKKICDPKMLRNFCLYFWLFVASVLVSPIILPIKLIRFFVISTFEFLEKREEKNTKRWLESLKAEDAMNFNYDGYNFGLKIPKYAKKKYDMYDMERMWAKKNGIDITLPNYKEELQKLYAFYEEKRKKLYEKALEKEMLEAEAYRKRYAKHIERNNKRRERREKRQEKIDEMFEKIDSVFSGVKKSFSFSTPAEIVRATKKVIGLLITLIIMAVAYCIIQMFVGFGFFIYYYWTETLEVLMIIGTAIVLVAAIMGLIFSLGRLGNILDKMNREHKLYWWAAIFYYPGIAVVWLFTYTVWYPFYFIFYIVLWNFFIIRIIVSIFTSLAKGFLKFFGVFGEYFSASYNDYCPGIEWEEEKSENEENE